MIASPVVWTLSLLAVALLATMVYFAIFFMIVGLVGWVIVQFIRSIVRVLRFQFHRASANLFNFCRDVHIDPDG